jgi:hypothetical protein
VAIKEAELAQECPLAIDIYEEFDMLEDERIGLCTGCQKPISGTKFVDSESFENYKRYGLCQKCQNTMFRGRQGLERR